MALGEADILRYSRQILLREVGGRGQERLLAGGVRLGASGEAGLTAAAYVVAGGTPVVPDARPLREGAEGFLVPAGHTGESAADVLAAHLPGVPPGALAPGGGGRLAEVPAQWDGEGPWVALGGDGARGVVVFRGPEGCAACFAATVAGLGPPPGGLPGVGLGALGALILQRLLLGLGPALGARGWQAPGILTEGTVHACGRCG
ncbi:ThiF family adenylyltransferase [Archangium primigenium]|uniref:ThiF family adenylyltransferase n=1 Tax=[Archangium] primigenium TaxID=2792470 RepID=UPI00195CEC38|nr:ThiF family adenylyltransferase [Archangium primigenium]MBM7117183.1 ThiF family adenylyltransferase [Archangium primigenium]